MSISLKQHKETENKVHATLYNNIILLTNFYPTRKEFDAVIRKDMFVKNNKAAFFEVVYYLLNILNPQLIKEKLPSWPPYDIKRETKFRSELLHLISDINARYDHAEIPVLMSSTLISPGGLKFAKFILSLSQLVVFEHLKKSGVGVDFCFKPPKNQELNTVRQNQYKKRTALVENETADVIKQFEIHHFKANETALNFVGAMKGLNECIKNFKLEYTNTKTDFDSKYPDYPTKESIDKKVENLKEKAKEFLDLIKFYDECKIIMERLTSPNRVLKFDKDNCVIPKHLKHMFTQTDELNLTEFYEALTVHLKSLNFKLPIPTESFMSESQATLQSTKSYYENLDEQNNILYERNKKLLDNVTDNFGRVLLELRNRGDTRDENNDNANEVLAVPLED